VTARFDDVEPQRRRIMSAVGQRDTKPEMQVRRLLHSMNYRYRLHQKDRPGRPDIVFGGRQMVIFIHYCFWHRHLGCPKATSPKTRAEFWSANFDRNVERDREIERRLAELGWKSLVVWECETRSPDTLPSKLSAFLEDTPRTSTDRRIAT
jgi:DNA mismatch endonuclease (patch repair protein)